MNGSYGGHRGGSDGYRGGPQRGFRPGPRRDGPPSGPGGPRRSPPRERSRPYRIIHKDEHVVVVDKASWLPVVLDPGEPKHLPCLVTALRRELRKDEGPTTAWTVHQMDAEACGLVALARTPKARDAMRESLRRTLTAIVEGVPPETGIGGVVRLRLLEHADGRVVAIQDAETRAELNRARDAVTHYQFVRTDGDRSVLRLRGETSRRRQFIAHLRAIGCPILGDPGDRSKRRRGPPPRRGDRGPRLALHGSEISFTHPASGAPMRFQLDPPEPMLNLVGESRDPAQLRVHEPTAEPPPAVEIESPRVRVEPPKPPRSEPQEAPTPTALESATPTEPAPSASVPAETEPPPAPTSPPAAQPDVPSAPPIAVTPAPTQPKPAEPTPEEQTPAEPAPAEAHADRGWDHVARWYDELTEDHGGDLYENVILPGTQRLLGEVRGQKVLDVACGQGVLCRTLHESGASVVGVDAGPRLIEAARARSPEGIDYHVADARKLGSLKLKQGSFDAAACVMALMNIDPLRPALRGIASLVRPGGEFVAVMIHPAFRAPKATSWRWTTGLNPKQIRQVESYLTQRQIPITMNPGAVSGGAEPVYTWTYHRPIADYVRELSEAGFWIDAIEEWASSRTSQPGPRAEEENRARTEIPMFLAVRAIRRIES